MAEFPPSGFKVLISKLSLIRLISLFLCPGVEPRDPFGHLVHVRPADNPQSAVGRRLAKPERTQPLLRLRGPRAGRAHPQVLAQVHPDRGPQGRAGVPLGGIIVEAGERVRGVGRRRGLLQD